jgi:hypothetical protein
MLFAFLLAVISCDICFLLIGEQFLQAVLKLSGEANGFE